MAWTRSKKLKVLKLYKTTGSTTISKLTGVPTKTIARWAKNAGISRKRGQRDSQYGDKNPNYDTNKGIVHNKDIMRKAVLLRENGLLYREIKEKLGISSSSVLAKWFRDAGIKKKYKPRYRLCLDCGKTIHFLSIRCHSCAAKGAKSSQWKGGKKSRTKALMDTREYQDWRLSIFKRDGWTCQGCNKVGGSLHAHHILGFTKYPTLRFELRNGITLCKNCHYKLHYKKYGRRTA